MFERGLFGNPSGRQSSNAEKPTKKERYVAVKADGRKHRVDISGMQSDLIGSGGYGMIRRVDADIVRPREFPFRLREGSRAVGNMVVKELYGIWATEEHLRRSLDVYQAIRKVGIDTWNTYRRLEGEPAILMTDGERDGSVVFSKNVSVSREAIDSRSFHEIDGFVEVVSKAMESLARANEHGIGLSGDAWFAGADVPESDEAISVDLRRIFVGDFDIVLVGAKVNDSFISKNCLDFESFVGETLIPICLVGDRHQAYRETLGHMMESRFPGYRSRYGSMNGPSSRSYAVNQ